MTLSTTLELLQWAAIVVLAVCLLSMTRVWLRVVASPAPTTGQAKVGDLAPPVRGLGDIGSRGDTVLLFVSNGCVRCADAVAALREARAAQDFTFAVLLKDEASLDMTGADAVVEDAADAFADYHIAVTPTAVLAERGGRIVAINPVGSSRAIHGLVASLSASPDQRGREVSW